MTNFGIILYFGFVVSFSMLKIRRAECMENKSNLMNARLEYFTTSLIQRIQEEREYKELEKQGKTWNVIAMDGTVLYKGIRNPSHPNTYPSIPDEPRLFNHW